MTTPTRRPRLATAWLGGCSGCHMSLLDLDEALLDVAARADIVFGPLVDTKVFPPDVDVTLVEGAVANTDNLELAHRIRANTRLVVAFGDCAITGNITALRNGLGEPSALLQRVYADRSELGAAIPHEVVPELLPDALPLAEVIDVDIFLPGCPPSARRITDAVMALLDALDAGVDPMTIQLDRPATDLTFGN